MITIRKSYLALAAAVVLGWPAHAVAGDKQASVAFDGVANGSHFSVSGYNSDGFNAPGRLLQLAIVGRDPIWTFGDETGYCIVTYEPYTGWMSLDGPACSISSGASGSSGDTAWFDVGMYFFFHGYVDIYVDCIDEEGGIGPIWQGSGWIPGYEP